MVAGRIALGLALALPGAAYAQEGPAGPAGPAGPSRPAATKKAGWAGFAFGPDPADPKLVRVLNVAPGSPAARSGLRVGQVIVAVDGKPVAGPGFVKRVLTSKTVGEELQLAVLDGERSRQLTLKLVERDLESLCERALNAGVTFLLGRMQTSGAWQKQGLNEPHDVPFSSLCLRALAGLPEPLIAPHKKRLQEGLDFLLRFQIEDGSIVGHTNRQTFRTYTSALTLQSLCLIGEEPHAAAREKLAGYLRQAQLDDAEGMFEYDFTRYGGWNLYDASEGGTLYSDVSNTSYALEALGLAGLDPKSETARKAQLFLRRSQNLPRKGSKLPETLFDGGFTVNARSSKAGRQLYAETKEIVFRPYGSTTADGLRSLLRLGIAKDDLRVQLAVKWLGLYFNTDKNPNFPSDQREMPDDLRGVDRGIYYYYLNSFTDAASLYGQAVLTDRKGDELRWAERVVARLVGLQKPDGAWRGDGAIMNEDDPNLATAFALMALARCQPFLGR